MVIFILSQHITSAMKKFIDPENIKFLYFKYSYVIKPMFISSLIVIIPLSMVIGYVETERVWNNLAYINEYGEIHEGKLNAINYRPDWIQLGIPLNKRDIARARFDSIFNSKTKDWPISFFGDRIFADTLKSTITVINPDSSRSTRSYNYYDRLFWRKSNGSGDTLVTFTTLMDNKQETIASVGTLVDSTIIQLSIEDNYLDSLQSKINKLYATLFNTDSSYTMFIEEWKYTDTLKVRFIQQSNLKPD